MKLHLAVSAIALAFAAPALADTVIDTTAPFSGDISSFGVPNTATYGQTFTAGSDNVLESFSLYLDDTPATSLDFKAYVYAWDGTKATGSALYASALQTFMGTTYGSPQEFAFSTGGTALLSGQQYVAFFTTSGLQSGANTVARMPLSSSNAYGGGSLVFFNNGNDFSRLTTQNWSYTNGSIDAWFKATLSDGAGAVPEPASWAMMLLGFGALGCAMRARRQGVAFA